MSFGAQLFGDAVDSAGIFRVDFAAGLERAPERRDAFGAVGPGFGRGMRGDPRKDAGRDRATEVRVVLFCEGGAEFVDGDDASARDAFHQGVDFARGGNDKRAFAEAFAEFAGDLADFGKAFVIGQLFTPRFFHV